MLRREGVCGRTANDKLLTARCREAIKPARRRSSSDEVPVCLSRTGAQRSAAAVFEFLRTSEKERSGPYWRRPSATNMSAATASIADVSKTDFTNRDDSRRNSGHPLTQCTPIPLPALGTQKIIQGNGTNVGTVISLQCPAKHKLVGSEVKCVMDTNSTHWVGETYCKPMSPYEDYGFRVAVLASIVSSAIIFFMSVAFITCCLLDCIKEDKRKKQERESDYWQWEEQAQHHESRSRYSRNNNNNNAQEKPLSLWDGGNPALCDNMRPYRCQQQHAYGPACTFSSTPPLAPLPGHDYDQPLLAQNTESGPPQYPRPPRSPRETTSSGLVQISAVGSGLMLQCGEHQSTLSGGNPSTTGESSIRNMNANRNVNLKEFSIRIISV